MSRHALIALAALAALSGLSCTAAYDSDDFRVCDEPECLDEVISGRHEPACERATWACAKACEDDQECLGVCVARDPSVVSCTLCVLNEAAVCGRESGCRCEWDDVRCCREANGCRFGADCPPCAAEDEAWDACFASILDVCVDELERCVDE